jgi:hypothetical protein
MHAVLTTVTVQDPAAAVEYLKEQVVPNVSQAPGFVAGYWVRDGEAGRGTIVFDSEDAARAVSDQISERIAGNPGVTLDSVNVGEVVASA